MTAQTDLYDSIVSDVVTLTNRPDLEEECLIAVRTATLSVHSDAAYSRDLVTQLVRIPNPSYQWSIDHTQLLPRLRGLSSVRLVDATGNPLAEPRIEVVEVGDIYDEEYGTLKYNVAYLAGTSVNFRTSLLSDGALVSYFQLPLIRREQYNSWIAQIAPDAILYKAAAIVFSTNGNEEKAAKYDRMYETQLKPQLVSNFATGAMR